MVAIRVFSMVVVILLVLAGCATAPEEEPTVIIVEEPEPEPEPEPEVVEEPEPDVIEPELAQEPEPIGPIEVDEELYNRAFAEVEAVIEELNEIISSREFGEWQNYLTPEYIAYHSDPEVLDELSRLPILSQNNIRLRSLRDYFMSVVVPSRARARLDDLVFYSDTLVEAVTEFRGERVLLYLLRRVDGEWKIDTEETLPERNGGE